METLQDEIQKEINTLQDIINFLESEEFLEHFHKPLEEYRDELKDAYDCDSLKELYAVKGKKEGINKYFAQIESIRESIAMKRAELK